MQTSILDSVKQQIGLTLDQDAFDPQIIMHINSTFSVLHQLGLGPRRGFSIDDNLSLWEDFIGSDDDRFSDIKTYMGLKVRYLFDPPTNSSVLAAMERQISEYEWRLNIAGETYEPIEEDDLF